MRKAICKHEAYVKRVHGMTHCRQGGGGGGTASSAVRRGAGKREDTVGQERDWGGSWPKSGDVRTQVRAIPDSLPYRVTTDDPIG